MAKVVGTGSGTADTLSPNMEISATSRGTRAQNTVIVLNKKYLPKGLYIPSTALNLKSSPTFEATRLPEKCSLDFHSLHPTRRPTYDSGYPCANSQTVAMDHSKAHPNSLLFNYAATPQTSLDPQTSFTPLTSLTPHFPG